MRVLLEPTVRACGLDLDSVVVIRQGSSPLVRVTVEAPEGADGIDSDSLADVSRAVSKKMDEADPIDSEYLLEVSTPGAERELVEPRHWRRQVGRLARVKTRDGVVVTGRVTGADDEAATLDVDGQAMTVAYSQIRKARARVEFGSED
ncbi:ribosome maturation factor RimP [Actinomyces sp. B33]|nr:ribosome maturation factor RimP [Actinomyces sp. B33]MDC4233017.1 ribosome maturation factor RimP [Actinomyces sp. B33]